MFLCFFDSFENLAICCTAAPLPSFHHGIHTQLCVRRFRCFSSLQRWRSSFLHSTCSRMSKHVFRRVFWAPCDDMCNADLWWSMISDSYPFWTNAFSTLCWSQWTAVAGVQEYVWDRPTLAKINNLQCLRKTSLKHSSIDWIASSSSGLGLREVKHNVRSESSDEEHNGERGGKME